MLSFSWRTWLRTRTAQSVRCGRNRSYHPVKLFLEPLESRDLLSAIATPTYEILRSQNGGSPMSGPGPGSGYSPSQMSQAYGFNQLSFTSHGTTVAANGAGETIAIVDAYDDPTIASDLQAFDKQYGLPDPSFQVLNQNGGTTLPGVDSTGSWEVEESLDVEWAHAMAPGANIVLIEANSDNLSDLTTGVQTAAALPGVVAVSMSWGSPEFTDDGSGNSETYYDSSFTAPLSNPGVVFIVSSGDSGAPPEYPAVSPNVLSVGGTTLHLDIAGDYISESAWGGSGGGVSTIEPLPSYQPSSYSDGSSTVPASMRMNPDVAYDADPNTGFSIYDSYNYGTTNPWETLGGTSDAAPQWASIVAIADQGRQLAGETALSGPNQLLPYLYAVSGDFRDITSGTTTGVPHYTAGTGYDLTTGLGSPIVNYVVNDLIKTSVPATPTGLTAAGVSDNQINLTWDADLGANTYTIQRSLDDATWSVLGTTNVASYSDSGLQPTTTYYYRILATNGFGSSAYTTSVSGTTQADTAAASFLKSDASTEGSWQGVYGSQGYNVIDNAVNYPSYALVSASGNSNYVWAGSTTDPRALQDASGSGRIAATWYSASNFTVNVSITDGKTHQLALYLLDWDNNGRSEQIQVVDTVTGKVLDTETGAGFQNGDYLVWNITGNVQIRISDVGGANAVLSGLFFDPAGTGTSGSGSATFLKSDITTEGSWQGVYGSQGFNVIDNAVSYPSYATVSASGNSNYVWAGSTTDPRALQDAGGSGRIAATWYSASNFTVNVNITDGKTHQLALYLLDWDNNGRSEQVQIVDAATGKVLDSESASSFQNGEYLVWNVSGDVVIRIIDVSGANAVLSGLFFDASGSSSSGSGSATFLKSDTTTEGSWQGKYGSEGYNVIDNAVNYPSYATVNPSGNSNWTWASSTSDTRALEDASGSGRIAAAWYSASNFNINVNITDGKTHQLALYLLDWDNNGRSEQVQILDGSTGKVLDTETASGFQNGDYLVWNVSGNIVIRITDLSGANAVLSGLFFGPQA